MGLNIGYVRVSTVEQNEARQLEAISQYKIDKWFKDKQSGKNTNREEFQKMLEFVREGDTVYVTDWSRLSRSTVDLLKTISELHSKGVKLISLKEDFNTSSPTGKLMLTLIAAINEFERLNLLERQREGIEIAKKAGKYKGRKPNEYDSELLKEIISGLASKSITVTEASRQLGCTRQSVYNILKRGKSENENKN